MLPGVVCLGVANVLSQYLGAEGNPEDPARRLGRRGGARRRAEPRCSSRTTRAQAPPPRSRPHTRRSLVAIFVVARRHATGARRRRAPRPRGDAAGGRVTDAGQARLRPDLPRRDDPWAIGDAGDPRYDLYRDYLLAHVRGGGILDIGCGLGAFLAGSPTSSTSSSGSRPPPKRSAADSELRPGNRVRARAGRTARRDGSGRPRHSTRSSSATSSTTCLAVTDGGARVGCVAPRANGRALVAAGAPAAGTSSPTSSARSSAPRYGSSTTSELPVQHVALVARPKLRLAAFTDAAPKGAVLITAADQAPTALPREPSPEGLRWRRRLPPRAAVAHR